MYLIYEATIPNTHPSGTSEREGSTQLFKTALEGLKSLGRGHVGGAFHSSPPVSATSHHQPRT